MSGSGFQGLCNQSKKCNSISLCIDFLQVARRRNYFQKLIRLHPHHRHLLLRHRHRCPHYLRRRFLPRLNLRLILNHRLRFLLMFGWSDSLSLSHYLKQCHCRCDSPGGKSHNFL